MYFKDKNDDIAAKDFSAVLNQIINEAKLGNSGLIFASTYTINTQMRNMLRLGLSSLYNALNSLTPSIVSIWLLPPPTVFSGSYTKQHIQGILDLWKVGAFVWFDPVVHAKFLLCWTYDQAKSIKHCRYFGSTNFTKGGLITNIEEFHFDVNVQFSSIHAFYFKRALNYLDNIIKLCEERDYWNSMKIRIEQELKTTVSETKMASAKARLTPEKLKVARNSLARTSEILTLLWNLPGRRLAYDITETFLSYFEFPWFEESFLEETEDWSNDVLVEFIDRWKIDPNVYLRIASSLTDFLSNIKVKILDYFERGYQSFLFREEETFLDQIRLKKDTISRLKGMPMPNNL
ncbi:MAG: hypothetical protein QXX08_04645 [Candidatus Bathyarchaeia archaeon]